LVRSARGLIDLLERSDLNIEYTLAYIIFLLSTLIDLTTRL